MSILRIRYIIAVLCGFLILGLGVFCAVSCQSQHVSEYKANELEDLKSDVSAPGLVTAADAGEEASVQAFLLPGMADGPDIILAVYHDTAFQEDVVDFFWELTGSLDVARAVLSNAAVFDIPPALAFALCWEESRYNPKAFNRNRNETLDRGLFQLNSATFPKLTVDDFYDTEINARFGLSHLRWCLNNAGTDVAGLAMYNAGHNRVRSAGTPKTTLDYVSRILNRQRVIEGLFLAEYTRIVQTEIVEEEIIKPAGFRLSLLTPLGR